MSNERTFYGLCKIMANLEDTINSFENIGFIVEPGNGKGSTVSDYLYNSCDVAYHIANDLLTFPNVEEENNVCNELMSATNENVDEVSRKIWEKYGIKDNI